MRVGGADNLRRSGTIWLIGTLLTIPGLLWAAAQERPPQEPVQDLMVQDKPADAGHALRISFSRSPGDSVGNTQWARYELLRHGEKESEFKLIRSFPAQERTTRFTLEDTNVLPNRPYVYQVRAVAADSSRVESAASAPVRPLRQWFLPGRLNTLIATLGFVAMILVFIFMARRGRSLFIRRIAGLDAIDEAVGRCTEMGRPSLFVPGMGGISDVATLASLNILGQVAKRVATYQSRILVPNRDAIVFPITQDVVKQGFVEAGYAASYREDDVYFVTHDQFAYAAAVCGTMVRERPGANLLLGTFYAEALILAETGASVGAIQIAGTDAISQLPFFVTACDYTIIGEELYAASAYIAREPTLLGSLKGQDVFKMVCIVIIVLGVLAMTAGVLVRGRPYDWILRLVQVAGGAA